MRIVGGLHRGRTISAPAGVIARPTTDRVREALFSILTSRDDVSFEDARVIDLFAGSGALGLESMSRGASFCLFVEENAAARGAIRENADSLGLVGSTRIHRRSAISLGQRPTSAGDPFSIAFLDPPYGKGLADKALEELTRGWLADKAIIVVEQGAKEPPASATNFLETDRRQYGDTQIGLYCFSA